jgi:hypothetical protein
MQSREELLDRLHKRFRQKVFGRDISKLRQQHGSWKESYARSKQSLHGSSRPAVSGTPPAKGMLIICLSYALFWHASLSI